MPTYEYKCTNCGYIFDEFQKITDEPLKECPECKGNLKRMIGPGATPIFKGSGFYQTDYKSSGEKSNKSDSSKLDIGSEKSKTEKKDADKKD